MQSFDQIRSEFFPYSPTPGCTVRSVDAETVSGVVDKLMAEVFSPMTDLGLAPFQPPPEPLAETWNVHEERFVFYDSADNPIGWSISAQREPDTLFMIWTGVLPAHQDQGIYSSFLRHYLDYAKALGFARVTSNHMVNNRRVLVAKLKAGFVASGMTLDERWGARLWLTCHLNDELAATYRSAFSLETYS